MYYNFSVLLYRLLLAAVLECCDIQPTNMDTRRADHLSLSGFYPKAYYIQLYSLTHSSCDIGVSAWPAKNTTEAQGQAGNPAGGIPTSEVLGDDTEAWSPSPSSGVVIPIISK